MDLDVLTEVIDRLHGSDPSTYGDAESIRGLAEDRLEIRPGQANALKFMSRVAPDFILKQLSKPVDRMLAEGAKR